MNSLGSVIFPFMAVAAQVAGLARKTLPFGEPILPTKFLLVLDTHTSPSETTPI